LFSLSSILISILAFLPVLCVVVTIHELGHFWVARLFKVKVDRFSIGFGRALLSRTDKHGIEWRVGWLPLGGYVKFSGDMDASSVPDQAGLEALRQRIVNERGPGAEQDYFYFKPIWQRALVVAAGPLANFLLAIVIFTIFFATFGVQTQPARVEAVVPGSPAAAAGFQPQDVITAVNGGAVTDADEVTRIVALSAGERLQFTVNRAGQDVVVTATPVRRLEQDPLAGQVRVARIGLQLRPLPGEVTYTRLNPVQAISHGVDQVGTVLGTTLKYLGRILVGKESGDMLSGPIGMAKAAGAVTEQAAAATPDPALKVANIFLMLTQMVALVSIGIGFVNLLPIPVLDGGHLLFYGYEAVAKRPVSARVQDVSYRVGLALLAGLMLFATWNDLLKQGLFNFLGGNAS
jgi:Predicted membrane-associated Zn-dependent proteases 1